MPNKHEFFFNINPGFPVRNARRGTEHPNPETSIFNPYQLQLIQKIVEANVTEQLEIAQADFIKDKQEEYKKGMEAGLQKALKQYQAQVELAINNLTAITGSLSAQYDKIKEEQEQDILNFIISLSQKVIDTELELNREVVLNVLKNALNLLNEREEIKILVNPRDWLTVKENINSLNLRIDLPANIEIINTPTISAGGVRVEFKSGSIDADIDTQFEEIKRKLLKYA